MPKSEKSLRSRSPGRKRKSSSRSRSRSRSRGRSRSPARTQNKSKQSPSPAVQRKTTPKQQRSRTPTTPTRQSRRLLEFAEKKEDEENNKQEEMEQKKTRPRDPPRDLKEQNQKIEKPAGKYYEYGGPLITFIMMFFVPAVLIYFLTSCTKNSCDIRKLATLSRDWHTYLDPQAAVTFLGFVAVQWILCLVPIGPVVEAPNSSLSYRLNGRFIIGVSLTAFSLLVYTGFPVSIVYSKLLPLGVTAILFSVVFSIYLHISSLNKPAKELNPLGTTGCTTHDFVVGREMNPQLGKLDVKWATYSSTIMGFVLVNMVFAVEAYIQKGQAVPYALYLVAAMQIVTCLNTLWNQEDMFSTLLMQHEGMGFFNVVSSYAILPFYYNLQIRYLLEHPVVWSYPALVAFITMFTVGFVIYQGSNSQKARFRKNAYDPAFVNMETIPTPGGKRLLASGWWGIVRHPNYLGDILMSIAWTLPCGFGSVLPYFQPLMSLLFLADRCRRDEHFCKEKHGAGWERYSQRVKYRMIPYVY